MQPITNAGKGVHVTNHFVQLLINYCLETHISNLGPDYPLVFQISKAYKPKDQWIKRGVIASAADFVIHFRAALPMSY